MHKFVEYFVTDDTLLAFVVGKGLPDNLAVHRVAFAYRDLANLVSRFRRSLTTRGDFNGTSSELFSILLNPLFRRGWLAPGETLWLAPHRCLRYIPFQAIGDGHQQLVDSNGIAYTP